MLKHVIQLPLKWLNKSYRILHFRLILKPGVPGLKDLLLWVSQDSKFSAVGRDINQNHFKERKHDFTRKFWTN